MGTVFIVIAFYKKEMASLFTNHLKETYGLVLKADDVNVSFFSNWPNASIEFKHISVANVLSAGNNTPLFNAGSVSLSFNLEKLLQKEFVVKSMAVKNAEINMLRDENGVKNFEFKQRDTLASSKSSLRFEIKKITIQNTLFTFHNKQNGQKIEFILQENVIRLKHYADGTEAGLKGDVFVKGLLFKKEKGAFLANTHAKLDLEATICFPRKELFIHSPSFVEIGKQRVDVSAFVELNENKQLLLNIETRNISYLQGISLLNAGIKKALSNVTVSNPVNAKILLVAKIGIKQEPIIIVDVSGKNNNITIGNSKIPYSDVSFNGRIVSIDGSRTMGNSEEATITFKPLKGKIYGLPFTGSVVIHNLVNPDIKINADLFIDAKNIPFKASQEFILKGTAIANIHYAGPVNKMNQKEFLDAPMDLKANVKFNNVSYREKIRPMYSYLVNGTAFVTNKELRFDKLLLKMNGGTLKLKGSVDNFVKYALGYTNGFKANLTASTNYFDLTGYVVKKKDSTNLQAEKVEKINAIDESKFEFDVSLAAKKLLVRKVEAGNASINLHYKNNLLDIKSLQVNTCDGSLSATGSIYDLRKINADITMQNININKLFDQFENFGQKAIEGQNLKGNAYVDATLKTELDENMEVIGKTIAAKVDLKLKDGHLLNYEPLQNISDYIFRNRDFKDISFSEINETFIVNGFKMDIQEMEIASNVLNLYMSGTYHFKEQSNINILLPWSNLKRRGKNYIPKSSGQTAENSKGLKLNYSGLPGKLKLSLGNK
jgi:hypothetical protein